MNKKNCNGNYGRMLDLIPACEMVNKHLEQSNFGTIAYHGIQTRYTCQSVMGTWIDGDLCRHLSVRHQSMFALYLFFVGVASKDEMWFLRALWLHSYIPVNTPCTIIMICWLYVYIYIYIYIYIYRTVFSPDPLSLMAPCPFTVWRGQQNSAQTMPTHYASISS